MSYRLNIQGGAKRPKKNLQSDVLSVNSQHAISHNSYLNKAFPARFGDATSLPPSGSVGAATNGCTKCQQQVFEVDKIVSRYSSI